MHRLSAKQAREDLWVDIGGKGGDGVEKGFAA